MNRAQWIAIALIGAFVAAEALVYAAPAPNNCGVNMLCRIRTLIVSGSASFNGGAVFDGGTTYNGDVTVNGDAGVSKNAFVGGTLATPTIISNVMDAGTGVLTGPLTVSGKTTLATLAITGTTDLPGGTLDVTGGATATVRSGAHCVVCWNETLGTPLTCTVSGTTLTVSGGVDTNAWVAFCPTSS